MFARDCLAAHGTPVVPRGVAIGKVEPLHIRLSKPVMAMRRRQGKGMHCTATVSTETERATEVYWLLMWPHAYCSGN